MGRKSEESLKLKKSLKHGSGCIFIFSSPDPASFFPFPFPSYRVFDPFFLMLASSGDSRFAGGWGWGGDGSVGKMLAKSKDLHSHPQNLCKTKGTLCSFSVPTGMGVRHRTVPRSLRSS